MLARSPTVDLAHAGAAVVAALRAADATEANV
jgi:hypothetical protein